MRVLFIYPNLNPPYEGTRHVIVRKDLQCSPCRNRRCKDVKCMEAISSQDVLNAVKTLLKMKDGSGG